MNDVNGLSASRDEAIEQGEVFYFTGLQCRKGHLAKRYTTSGRCIECARATFREKADRIKENRKRRLAETQDEQVVA